MNLLTNAIESIQAGVEDYLAGSRSRLLSAVRNIHAGILLLYKESLRRESPQDSNDVMMMAKILPARNTNGKIVFVGVGKNTVDVQQIKERFEALGMAGRREDNTPQVSTGLSGSARCALDSATPPKAENC